MAKLKLRRGKCGEVRPVLKLRSPVLETEFGKRQYTHVLRSDFALLEKVAYPESENKTRGHYKKVGKLKRFETILDAIVYAKQWASERGWTVEWQE